VVFLIAIGVSFFAKAGDQFSRAWLGAFYVLGLFALIAFRPRAVPLGPALDQGRPARPPHGGGRLRQ
jgi:CoA-binding protein